MKKIFDLFKKHEVTEKEFKERVTKMNKEEKEMYARFYRSWKGEQR